MIFKGFCIMADKKIKAAHIKRFLTLVEKLDDLMAEIEEYAPDACIYLNEDTFHLMKGSSHTRDIESRPLQENSVASVWVRSSSGGGW